MLKLQCLRDQGTTGRLSTWTRASGGGSLGFTEGLWGQMLRHGRDVHPTWASVDNVTATLRVWGSKSTKSNEDLESF